MFRIIATSDTHYTVDTSTVPEGDAFIHCGDLCSTGYPADFERQVEWLAQLPHAIRLFVCGNHDFHLQVYPGPALQQLRKAGVTVLGLPGNDKFCSYLLPNGMSVLGVAGVTNLPRWAFNRTEDELDAYLTRMGRHDIIVSHAPPRGVMDAVQGKYVGVSAYRRYLHDYNPKYWLSGHIHEGHGYQKFNNTHCYNVSMCDRKEQQVNPPTVIDIP